MSLQEIKKAPLVLSRVMKFKVLEPREAIRRLEVIMNNSLNPEALDVLVRLNRFNLPFSQAGKLLEAGVFEIGERLPLSEFSIDESQREASAEVALSYAVQALEDRELRIRTVGRYGLPIVCMEPIKMGGEYIISFGLKRGRDKQPFISLSPADSLPESCGLKYRPLYCKTQ
jgi:hypothetical protein